MENFSPLDAKADFLGDLDSDLDVDLCKEGWIMETDHGSFVMINVYVPNTGVHAGNAIRPRLNFKLRFLKALRNRCDEILNSGEDDYLPGNIVEIEIQNFMTYNHLRSKPGSRLNLVIGPNGTGKSSLVCAIAIGLAGEPQLLGRASNIGDYVKRGEASGWTKISLRGNKARETITITQKIDIQNKSEWPLNGRIVPKRDVLDTVHKFNIQVGNLTQFLPQERVCEFAKLSPVQLLEETETAVGDQELSVQHRALIDKSCSLKRLETTVKQNEETLDQLNA